MDKAERNLLRCTNLSRTFGYFMALKKISFEIAQNSTVGILGSNGAGKTTLLRIIAGLLSPTSGEISVAGMNYTDNPSEIKSRLGIFLDQSFLYQDFTIFENLKFYAHLFGQFDKTAIKEMIDRYTTLFNINEWIDEPIKNLSTGMRRKVELIRVLIHKPQLLLLDEPFSGLDFTSINNLLELIATIKAEEQVSFIITTHNISLAAKVCDRIIVLKRGKVNKIFEKAEFEEAQIEAYF